MSAPTSTISIANGNVAAANLSNGAGFYCDPGNSLTVALQSSTGVASWVLTLGPSDYGPFNGSQLYTVGAQGPFTFTFPAPQQPCKFVLTSEVTDGNNVFPTSNTIFNYPRATVPDRTVRYVCTANVNTANIAVAQDGVTGIAGDRILLVGQGPASQNGPWVIGAVTGGFAALSRPSDYQTGQVILAPSIFDASEGTTWSGSTWKNLTAGNCTVDTSTAQFYPKNVKGSITNVASANGNVTNIYVASGFVALGTGTVANCVVNWTASGLGAGTGFVTFSATANGLNANCNANYLIVNW